MKKVSGVVALAVMSAVASAQDVKAGQEKSPSRSELPFEGEVTVERLNVRVSRRTIRRASSRRCSGSATR